MRNNLRSNPLGVGECDMRNTGRSRMKFFRSQSDKVPAHITEQAEAVRSMPEADRREFIALASVFGATAAGAYGMLGMAPPAKSRRTRQTRRHAAFADGSPRAERPRAPLTGRRLRPTPQAGLSIWLSTTLTVRLNLCCWKAGKPTQTPLNMF